MKARGVSCLALCVLFLTACDSAASRNPVDAITFDTTKRLDDFEFITPGNGNPAEWSIIDRDAGRGLAQIDTESSENRLPFAVYRRFSGRDVFVSTRFLTISGKIDRAAGLLVRFRSPDDYYAARADALENNVSLYRVASGRRELIGFMEVNLSGQAWHTLGIAAKDDRLTVFLDSRELFVATDRRRPGPAGKVGLWTRADSMTLFEGIKIGAVD